MPVGTLQDVVARSRAVAASTLMLFAIGIRRTVIDLAPRKMAVAALHGPTRKLGAVLLPVRGRAAVGASAGSVVDIGHVLEATRLYEVKKEGASGAWRGIEVQRACRTQLLDR